MDRLYFGGGTVEASAANATRVASSEIQAALDFACRFWLRAYNPLMTATLSAPVEALLREQVANGHFATVDLALETAVKTVFGSRASQALENLLDAALAHPGERIPVSQLRAKGA